MGPIDAIAPSLLDEPVEGPQRELIEATLHDLVRRQPRLALDLLLRRARDPGVDWSVRMTDYRALLMVLEEELDDVEIAKSVHRCWMDLGPRGARTSPPIISQR